ncbi:MAG: 3-oxoacyl-[acyl-carrier-protein] reductase [Rhodobacteraceae bacterium]|nr:3-oxoacyl-[acyl-carrier-protein] reductase [Paracoccaceae bacterium]MBC66385.1 3-oxoacyl-[acyl-carrier-protein] reductase [Paracoccaceae bacterium]
MRQRVLITAGADGIGLEIAKCFLKKNALVWVADLNQNAIDNLPKSINARCVDVCDEIGMKALFDEISKTWGGLDVLCANAGIAGPTATIDQIALSDWQHCLKVNLDGTFIAAKYAASIFKKQGSGVINITSSTAGQYGYPNRSPYSTAKWGVLGLMKTLAMELGPFGVRVNAICPGAVEGARMERVMTSEAKTSGQTRDEIYKGYAKGTSMQKWVEGLDIAEMAVFLASKEARFVSGQTIAVDGDTFNPNPQL